MSKRFLKNYSILLETKEIQMRSVKYQFFTQHVGKYLTQRFYSMCKSVIRLAFPYIVGKSVKGHNFSWGNLDIYIKNYKVVLILSSSYFTLSNFPKKLK